MVPSSALRALRALIAVADTASQNQQVTNLQNGCCTNLQSPTPTQEQLAEIDRRILSAEAFSGPLEINRHVAADYARLRAAYAQGVAPRLVQAKKLKSMPPELWTQAIPASQLQITENDLWIAALAVTYEMTLVTGDKDYGRVAKHFPVLDILSIK